MVLLREWPIGRRLRRKMVVCSLSFASFVLLLLLLAWRKLFWVARAPSLKNKHVVVTGGSSGIGKATAVEASKLGANVTILARDEARLQEAAEEMKRAAKHPLEQKIQYFVVDVTKGAAAVGEVVKRAEGSAGPVFLLVNCVGKGMSLEFEAATESDFRSMMDANYFGTLFPIMSVAKGMKTRKEGHIVITASQSALVGIYGMTACSPSKFALRGLAESLAMELKPHDVSVTLCLPPDTDTPGFATEQRSRLPVTRLICVPGELFRAEDVARRLLSDALRRRFWSCVGLEGLVLSTLCSGMSPVGSLGDVLLQGALMGLLRLVSVGYLLYYQRIVRKALTQGNNSKKVG